MLLLGDIAADGRGMNFNRHYSDYLLRDMSLPWQVFSASMPLYASWDDWDYINNDASGLKKGKFTNEQRNTLRALWEENWVNPPTTVKDRGIYFNARLGDVEVIMLDTRSCRDGAKAGKLHSYLGKAQTDWLFKTLKASTAKAILLSSGTMWTDYVSKGKDSWGKWDREGREAIFRFLEQNSINNVILLSGDRHGARGFRIERPSGMVLYEFEPASLAGWPGPAARPRGAKGQLFGYNGIYAFGELTFDFNPKKPEATFRLIGEEGKELEKHVVPLKLSAKK